MKRILITENQFKRLVENIVSEQEKYDITKDPKALVLLDYLIEKYPDDELKQYKKQEWHDNWKVTKVGKYNIVD